MKFLTTTQFFLLTACIFLLFLPKIWSTKNNPKQGGFAADGSEELLGKHRVAWGWGGVSFSIPPVVEGSWSHEFFEGGFAWFFLHHV